MLQEFIHYQSIVNHIVHGYVYMRPIAEVELH